MKNLSSFDQYLREAQNFDTRMVDSISELQIGDEVFNLGDWMIVTQINPNSAVITDPRTNKSKMIMQADVARLGVLIKIPEVMEGMQAQEGQPGVPQYSYIELPQTNQRIEGPKKTEGAVRKLLRTILAEQERVRDTMRGSQAEARNEAGNVLFNYSDELSGLGWIIV